MAVQLDNDIFVEIARHVSYNVISSTNNELLWKMLCKDHFRIGVKTMDTWKEQYHKMITFITRPFTITCMDRIIMLHRFIWNAGNYLIKHIVHIIPLLGDNNTFQDFLNVLFKTLMVYEPKFTLIELFGKRPPNMLSLESILSMNIVDDLMIRHTEALCKLYGYNHKCQPNDIYDSHGDMVKTHIYHFLNKLTHVLWDYWNRKVILKDECLHRQIARMFPFRPFWLIYAYGERKYKTPKVLYRLNLESDMTRDKLLEFFGIRDMNAIPENPTELLYALYRMKTSKLLFSRNRNIEVTMNRIAPSGFRTGNPTMDRLLDINSLYIWKLCDISVFWECV